MADGTYQATLAGEGTDEQVELEFIAGEPQKSFTRTATVDGQELQQLWELDLDAPEYTYRPGGFPEHDYS